MGLRQEAVSSVVASSASARLLFRGCGETSAGLVRPSVSVRAEGRPGAPELMVSFRHKMGFLCQAGAMNSFGDAALPILQRTGARAPPPRLPPPTCPPALRAGILIKANCRLPSGQSCLRDTKTEGEARRRPVLICWFSPFFVK